MPGYFQMRLGQGAGWLLLLSLLAAVPLATARADSIVWTERNNGDLTTLAYGPLDPAKAPIFLLSCFNEMEIAVLNVHHEIDGKEGDAITIELSSAKAQAPVAAEIAKNRETGNTYGEASDIKMKPILKVLRDPGPITLTIGKMEVTLSEAGREQAAADFAKACKLN